MENLVHYYNLVEHLLVVTGKWVRIYALYEDLIGRYGEPSEKSKKVFKAKYHDKYDEMYKVGNTYSKDALKTWGDLRKYLIMINAYDKEAATLFTGFIQYRHRSSSFRRMALRWTRRQLQLIKQGKEVKFYTLQDYLDSHAYYEMERMKDGKRHFKGLHKQDRIYGAP